MFCCSMGTKTSAFGCKEKFVGKVRAFCNCWTNCSSSGASYSGEEKTSVPGLAEDCPSVLGRERSLGIGLVHDVGCEEATSKSSCAVSPNSLPNSLPGDEDLL